MNERRIVLGVTGGVAAYKSAALASLLVQRGAVVQVVMTEAARQFIGEATFAALTSRAVASHVFDQAAFPLGAHIHLAEDFELLCVAPATADFLAKAAHGQADDLLSTLYLAFRGPVLCAPAMNTAMWEQPATQRNLQLLRDDGVKLIGPEAGWLSCRTQGQGRMSSPEDILANIEQQLQAHT